MRTFVETYSPLACRVLPVPGLQDSDVADVTQEVMTQVLRSITAFTYQPDRGRFRDWLGAITRTKLLRFLARSPGPAERGGPRLRNCRARSRAPSPTRSGPKDFMPAVLEVAMQRLRPNFEEATWRIFERPGCRGKQPPRFPGSGRADRVGVHRQVTRSQAAADQV